MGCRYCMVSCPYDIPKFEYFSSNPKIQKCTMCFENRSSRERFPLVWKTARMRLLCSEPEGILSMRPEKDLRTADVYIDQIYGEHEAGGTGWL